MQTDLGIVSSKSYSVTDLIGVGDVVAEHLEKIDIETIQDLLFHFPIRYQDRTKISSIKELKSGDFAVIEGEIIESYVQNKGKKSLLCTLKDDTGSLQLRFFHFSPQQQKRMNVKHRLFRCFGEVREGFQGQLEIVHPECYQFVASQPLPLDQGLTPIYPSTKGLAQQTLRRLIQQALDRLSELLIGNEWLPSFVAESYGAWTFKEAIEYVHRPPIEAPVEELISKNHVVMQRLIVEELVTHQLALLRWRQKVKNQTATALEIDFSEKDQRNLLNEFLQQLPFSLTKAQEDAWHDVQIDMKNANPMLRLIQGDVGSGKTVVAALAMLQSVQNGLQAAIMVPTEILAEQHFQNLSRWFNPLNVNVGYLVGNQSARERVEIIQKLESGEVQVVVGTHALFQQEIVFNRLGLIVVDEQHRFGVHQRLLLKEKAMIEGYHPHQLIMTATPIPRTLMMTAYADLDISIIDELPPGRQPIETLLIPNLRRADVMTRVRANCQEGRQAYWVCTLIEDSPAWQAQAAQALWEELRNELPDIQIGLIHGRMSAQEKEGVMQAFKEQRIQLLVATTVIEVGVDVPNATIMVIENPERLGLAQLHQLRGRVGRGQQKSFCVLLYQPPLSPMAKERLQTMRDCQDGFKIAQTDLRLRGPGEVLGTRQTGLLRFKIADLIRDEKIVATVKPLSEQCIEQFSECVDPLIMRWLPKAETYGEIV